ncbi:hypothetical protein, partial [Streptomyces sp. NRRL WC-3626]|uniref:hypothetical protein n=1 Tax=Streptomyces sp. NRRL WC-3626 TaxID=1463926 RepID=UPI001F32617F
MSHVRHFGIVVDRRERVTGGTAARAEFVEGDDAVEEWCARRRTRPPLNVHQRAVLMLPHRQQP